MVDPAIPWYKIPEWWLCILGVPTLGFVGWQSWETRKAAQATRDNAAAALSQVEFMKSKERAQLRIELAQPDFSYDAKLKGYTIAFRITLDGATRAYILE